MQVDNISLHNWVFSEKRYIKQKMDRTQNKICMSWENVKKNFIGRIESQSLNS